MAQMNNPVVSCLCITYNRPAFHDFLLWNYNKQTFKNRELVVVDGSDVNYENKFKGQGIRYVHVKGEHNIPKKRNIALAEAQGDIITWFDDDDWQHPDKCQIIAENINDKKIMVGSGKSIFYNMDTGCYSNFQGSRILFNSMGVVADPAKTVRFDEKTLKASDSKWRKEIEGKIKQNNLCIIKNTCLFFWLCHKTNISNPGKSRKGGRKHNGIELDKLLGQEKGAFYHHIENIKKRMQDKCPVIEKSHGKPAKVNLKPASLQKKNIEKKKQSRQASKPEPCETRIFNKKSTNILVGINVWNQFEEARHTYLSFINSILHGGKTADFLVVDDNSGDKEVREYFEPLAKKGKMHYIRNAHQFLLTRSWNKLLNHALSLGYDYVIQSNGDVRFPVGWLDRFIVHLEKGADFLVPMTNQPGRFSGKKQYQVQDIRNLFPGWLDLDHPQAAANDTFLRIINNKKAVPVPSANGFFIGFRTDFLKKNAIKKGEFWSEHPRHLAANKGIGGDESEIRKRTGVKTYLAQDVYIHHMRPYGRNGRSREEYLQKRSFVNK